VNLQPASVSLGVPRVHDQAQLLSRDPLQVATPRQCWAYALSFDIEAIADACLVLDIQVIRGRVSVGITRHGENVFVVETMVSSPRARVRLPISHAIAPLRLIVRNADPSGASSVFVVDNIGTSRVDLPHGTYNVSVMSRHFAAEEQPRGGHAIVFDDQVASDINAARLQWLEAVDLPVAGKRVLDAGCGVGHFGPFYLCRGCSVTGLDGRAENIAILRERHPRIDGRVGDLQTIDLSTLGDFDVVHCFGLLYHLDSPVAALRNMHAVCRELLVLETMVCDSSRPLVVLADEDKSVNQALEGLGCRPSPSFVALALNRIGFRCVYGTNDPPHHPDFQIAWNDDLAVSRAGANLRCIFVASREPIDRPLLVSLLDE
jgi:SAM-dependent methyltransferase